MYVLVSLCFVRSLLFKVFVLSIPYYQLKILVGNSEYFKKYNWKQLPHLKFWGIEKHCNEMISVYIRLKID
jgi:hypothetical protein